MKIGFTELIVIFVVALIVIGPDKLPFYARKLGAALKEFRKASSELTAEIRESVVEPLEEAQKPIREALEPLEELNREVRDNVKGLEKDIKEIGKPKKEPEKKTETKEAGQMETQAEQAPLEEEALADTSPVPEPQDAPEDSAL